MAVIVVLALAASARGMNEIPLESHEIYVAQTAENMIQSGDWLVPRLNGEYRLTKPPLSYWLVAGAAVASGHDQVGPGIARLPSVLAVVGIALLAMWIVARLFDRRTGILAGLMCAACLTAFKYGHNARPDMLYAFWTTAVLAVWVGGRQADPARQGRWIAALWVLFGLATLTKGPQAPLILLAGLSLHVLWTDRQPRRLLRELRLFRGVLLVLAMVVPWYLLLRYAIGSQTLGDSQLSGELLTINPLRLFTTFYLAHSPLLWMPWALLAPPAVVCVWRDPRGPAGLLAWTIVFAMLAFALGPQYRQIYMLPWLAPAMVLFAAAVSGVAWAGFIVAFMVLLVAVAIGWLVYQAGAAALIGAVAALLLLGGAVVLLRWRRRSAATILVAAAFALGLFQGGAVPALWSSSRYADLAFIQALSSRIQPRISIIVWDANPATYSYYLGRPVTGREDLGAVCDWVARQQRVTLVIYPADRRAELARRLTSEPVPVSAQSELAADRVPAGTACRVPSNVEE